MDGEASDELLRQIEELGGRVRRLEETLDRLGVDAGGETLTRRPAPFVRPEETSASNAAATGRATPPTSGAPAESGAPFATHPPRPRRSIDALRPPRVPTLAERFSGADGLESLVGSHLFNRAGIFAVLVGVAWFLKYAFDNHWIGPTGRVAIGLLGGVALVVWSERFRGRGYLVFSYALKAIGSGTLYLALGAAYNLYHLVPAGVAFVAMIGVTAWVAFMSWAQDSELLALYALVGGFATPVLTATGENHQLVLFTYVLVLDVAVLAMMALRPWSRLASVAFAATVALFGTWGGEFYTDAAFAVTAAYVAVFVLLFALAPCALAPLRQRGNAVSADGIPPHDDAAWSRLPLVLLPVANAGLGFLAYYAMLDARGRQWAQPWAAVAFAAFYLALLRLPAFRRLGEWPVIVESLYLTFTVAFLAVAVPLQVDGYWVMTGWLVEGAALTWVARRSGLVLLQGLGVAVLAIGTFALLGANERVDGPVIFNARFAAYVVGIAALAFVAWVAFGAARTARAERPAEKLAERAAEGGAQGGASGHAPVVAAVGDLLSWEHVAAAAVVAINVLVLVSVTLEIHTYWAARDAEAWTAERFTISVWWMILGAAILTVGFRARSAFLRWQALLLVVVSIGKVFVFDTMSLSQGYRVLSFLGLGALLLGVSFVYQRDWLGLHGGTGASPVAPESVE